MIIIKTEHLSKTFKSRKGSVKAVQDVSITVNQGEIFGFLGPNGAGKTTTMRMLSTLLEPTSGTATVVGYDLLKDSKNVRKKIGYVSQAGGVETMATGRENLILQARLHSISTKESKNRADYLINTLQMGSFADRLAKTYSGGQKRRLDIALGMIHRPPLLFLDEPTTGLDPQSRAHLWEEIRKLKKDGTAVFLTTHYLDEADSLCDRLAIIDNGSIVAEGTTSQLKAEISGDIVIISIEQTGEGLKKAESLFKEQSFIRDVQLNGQEFRLNVDQGGDILPKIIRLLDGAHLEISSISLHRPSLDDVFLKMTGHSLREESE